LKPFAFVPIVRADYPQVSAWLRQPHVERWWCDDPAPEAVEAEYGGVIDGAEAAQVFIAHREGRPVGLVQCFALADYPQYVDDIARWTEVPPQAWSLDYFIGEPDALRRGWGTALVGQLTDLIWAQAPDATAVIVPVQAGNRASWRVLERNGYRRVARGEFEPENPLDSPEHFILRLDRPAR
jgi:aminoglycoside 6'-N-acetyltransferase